MAGISSSSDGAASRIGLGSCPNLIAHLKALSPNAVTFWVSTYDFGGAGGTQFAHKP